MTELFDQLRRSIVSLEEAIRRGETFDAAVEERILKARTDRVAREPVQVDRAPDVTACLVFERSSRRYAVRLESLQDVGPIGDVAHVPGIPSLYLGVTARRGRVVPVVDLPQLFNPGTVPAGDPRWLVMASNEDVVCGVAADDMHDIIDVDSGSMARSMPTFPALVQRYTVGVLEDRTVVLDLSGLLADPSLRVEDRDG